MTTATTTRRSLRLAAAVLLALPLAGCLDLERELEVFADGSGRVVVYFGVDAMAERLARAPLSPPWELRGVCWEAPTVEQRAGMRVQRVVGYFAHVSAVSSAFELRPTSGGGLRLTRRDASMAQELGQRPVVDASALGRVESMFLVRERLVLPGDVAAATSHAWVRRDGARALELRVRGADLFAPGADARLAELPADLVAECGPPDAASEARRLECQARREALAATGASAAPWPQVAPAEAARALRAAMEQLSARYAHQLRADRDQREQEARRRARAAVPRVVEGRLFVRAHAQGVAPGWSHDEVEALARELDECGLADRRPACLAPAVALEVARELQVPPRWPGRAFVLRGAAGREALLDLRIESSEERGATPIARFAGGALLAVPAGERDDPELLEAHAAGRLPVLVALEPLPLAEALAALQDEPRPRAVFHRAAIVLSEGTWPAGIDEEAIRSASRALLARIDAIAALPAPYPRRLLALLLRGEGERAVVQRACLAATDLDARALAAGWLAASGEVTPAVIGALRDGVAAVETRARAAVAAALPAAAAGPEDEARVRRCIEDPSPEVRAGALQGCAERSAPPLPLSVVTRWLRDRSARVRAAALSNVARCEGPEVLGHLLAALHDDDPDVFGSAWWPLETRPIRVEDLPALRANLARGSERAPTGRMKTIELIARCEAAAATALLVEAILHEDLNVIFPALEALASRPIGPEAVAAMREAYPRFDWGRHEVALPLLGRADPAAATGALALVLEDLAHAEPKVQAAASKALDALTLGPDQLAPLAAALDDPHPVVVRVAAARALARLGDDGRARLRARRAVETDPAVQGVIDAALR